MTGSPPRAGTTCHTTSRAWPPACPLAFHEPLQLNKLVHEKHGNIECMVQTSPTKQSACTCGAYQTSHLIPHPLGRQDVYISNQVIRFCPYPVIYQCRTSPDVLYTQFLDRRSRRPAGSLQEWKAAGRSSAPTQPPLPLLHAVVSLSMVPMMRTGSVPHAAQPSIGGDISSRFSTR